MARLARILSTALITAAAIVLIDVGLTLAYQEPVSSLYGALKQRAASDELDRVNREFPSRAELLRARQAARAGGGPPTARERRRAEVLASLFARRVDTGDVIGRLMAPTMGGLDTVALQGTDTATLQRGPGHYPDTSFPGQTGTMAIAGHRTTYGAPFNEIAAVGRGDRIVLEMPYGTFRYRVTRTEIVTPDRVDVIDDVGYPQLVLSACHPLYSAAERYIVFARLAGFELD
ncbi:MAG TPA: class E sortase [Solirubrobacterales bacterium]|nr:class E sortase [Solirubrobacterales bacterium]